MEEINAVFGAGLSCSYAKRYHAVTTRTRGGDRGEVKVGGMMQRGYSRALRCKGLHFRAMTCCERQDQGSPLDAR